MLRLPPSQLSKKTPQTAQASKDPNRAEIGRQQAVEDAKWARVASQQELKAEEDRAWQEERRRLEAARPRLQTVEEISKAQEESAKRQAQESMEAKGQMLKLPPPQLAKKTPQTEAQVEEGAARQVVLAQEEISRQEALKVRDDGKRRLLALVS